MTPFLYTSSLISIYLKNVGSTLFFGNVLSVLSEVFFNHKTMEHYLKIESLDRRATFFEGV